MIVSKYVCVCVCKLIPLVILYVYNKNVIHFN